MFNSDRYLLLVSELIVFVCLFVFFFFFLGGGFTVVFAVGVIVVCFGEIHCRCGVSSCFSSMCYYEKMCLC